MKNLEKPLLHATLTGLTSLAAMTLGITATTAATAAATATTPAQTPAAPPAIAKPTAPLNVLFFTADDMGWFSVAAENSPAHVPDVTPNIDRFATQSMVFQRAHVNVAICQPSRGVLTTGMYPHTSGVEGFYHAPGHVNTIMSELRAHGYLVGILGKCEHCTPDASFKWDMWHDAGELGHGRNPQKYAAYFREFIERCKKEGKPFYFMCNSHDPHRPWVGSPGDLAWQREKNDYVQPTRIFKPDEMAGKIPGFLPDLPKIREDLAQYCSSARRCDDTFGAIMKVLQDEGLAPNTMIIFLSDNGIATPFAKTNAYYNSTRTPLIVNIPGVTKPGAVDNTHFVAGIDYMPTVLDALGYQPPAGVDGRTYLPLLRGEDQTGPDRDRVFTQIYETSGKNRYPMFTVQNANYILIYNPWSDGKYVFRAESLGGLTFKAMIAAAKTDTFIRDRVDLVQHRVPLELYDLKKDPDALVNLAKNPIYAGTLKQMSDQLKDWMNRYDTTPLPAFTAFPDDASRNAYMTAQKQLASTHAKKDKSAKKAAKKAAKKSGQKTGATNTDDEESDE